MLKTVWFWALSCTIILAAWFCLLNGQEVKAADPSISFRGISIELTREFYEALKQEGGSGSRTYSNDPRNEYLRRIAVSGEFAVKTNLTIVQQQEKIIELLEELQKQGQQQR